MRAMTDYRGMPAKCPACGAVMDERGAADVMIDVCPTCRGLWIDWFDGDTVDVAMKAAPLSMRAPVALDPSKTFCPRDQQPLNFSNHAAGEHATGPLTGQGPVILRCGECGGSFVPRTVFDELLELANPPAETAPNSPLGKLLAALKRIFAQDAVK